MEYRTNHEAVVKVLKKLNEVKGIDIFTMTKEAAEEISNLLKLNEQPTSEHLRAIRNSVVMIFSAFDNADSRIRMSAITGAIDNKMITRFGTL